MTINNWTDSLIYLQVAAFSGGQDFIHDISAVCFIVNLLCLEHTSFSISTKPFKSLYHNSFWKFWTLLVFYDKINLSSLLLFLYLNITFAWHESVMQHYMCCMPSQVGFCELYVGNTTDLAQMNSASVVNPKFLFILLRCRPWFAVEFLSFLASFLWLVQRNKENKIKEI